MQASISAPMNQVGTAQVATQAKVQNGSQTITLLGCLEVAPSAMPALYHAIEDSQPRNVAIMASRREAMLAFPHRWMLFRPSHPPQSLAPQWSGIQSLYHRLFTSQAALMARSGRPEAACQPWHTAVEAADGTKAVVTTVGPGGDFKQGLPTSALPWWLQEAAEVTSPTQVWRGLAMANRPALQRMAHAAVTRVAEKWEETLQSGDPGAVKALRTVGTVLPRLVGGGAAALSPSDLMALHTAWPSAVAGVQVVRGHEVHEDHVRATAVVVAEQLRACPGDTAAVLPADLLPAVQQAPQGAGNDVPQTRGGTAWQWRHTVLPASCGAAVIGVAGMALARRRVSRVASWTLRAMLGVALPVTAVATVVPVMVHGAICRDVSRAVALGGTLASHPPSLVAAESAWEAGGPNVAAAYDAILPR